MSSDSSFRPPLPLAKRLNRNALTVVAVLMGLTVLTAVVVLTPGREKGSTTSAEGSAAAAAPAGPTFLDEPATRPARPDVAPIVPGHRSKGRRGRLRPSLVASESGAELASGVMPNSLREQAFEAAIRSPVLAGAAESPSSGRGNVQQSASSADDRLVALSDSLTQAAIRRPGEENRPAARQREFLDRAGGAGGAPVLARLEPAGSPYTLRAGTVIPGVLLTAISSDLPGEIVGQVSRDVYDSRTQRILLVPRGAKLIGTYDNQVVAGQGRLLVAWTRLILPDGRSMVLPGLALKEPHGQTGIAGKVDRHFDRVFGNALLLSAISAGTQLSQPRQASILAAPSAGQVAAGALGQELSTVALETIRRGMDVSPTITIRQGQAFLVFLNGDVVFDAPYEPET